MKLKEIPSKSFLIKENETTRGEVRILPPALTGGPRQVKISTWNAKGRWKAFQEVIVDMELIDAIFAESKAGK